MTYVSIVNAALGIGSFLGVCGIGYWIFHKHIDRSVISKSSKLAKEIFGSTHVKNGIGQLINDPEVMTNLNIMLDNIINKFCNDDETINKLELFLTNIIIKIANNKEIEDKLAILLSNALKSDAVTEQLHLLIETVLKDQSNKDELSIMINDILSRPDVINKFSTTLRTVAWNGIFGKKC